MFLSRGDRDVVVAFQTHLRSQACYLGVAKDSALLSSPDGYLLEPTEWPKGSQASCGVWREASRLPSRPCRKRMPSSRHNRGVSWVFSSCGASVGFLTRYDGEFRDPLVRRQRSLTPCVWPGRSRYCSRAMVGESDLKTHLRRTLKDFLGLGRETLVSIDIYRGP